MNLPFPNPTSIYEEMINAGVEVSNWQSDMYVHVNAITKAILAKYPTSEANATIFKSNIDGQMMYDIPFMYQPFWDAHCLPRIDPQTTPPKS